MIPRKNLNRWFLKVYDGASGDQGIIQEFTISYQGQNYTSADPSVPITDRNISYAYIGNAPDAPPYFQDAALASDITRPETINFSGYAKDDIGLRKISLSLEKRM